MTSPGNAGLEKEPRGTRVPLSQLNLLVVDDDRDVLQYLEDCLTQEGYAVSCLSDPTEAIERLKAEAYQVVILDLMMPKLSGMDLLAQIRKQDDDVAIVVLTGYPTLETARQSIDFHVSAYLPKPCSMEELRATIVKIAREKGLLLRPEDDLHRTIGRTIRELRKGQNLTLKQLSRRTRLSVSLLSQIERAEASASVSSLYKIATALDVRLTELFGEH
jgi:DNA-binding response OmpR family regulator